MTLTIKSLDLLDKFTTIPKYVWQYIGTDIAGSQYDVAYVRMGDSWRMPRNEQQMELLENCTQT